jgi:thiamine transport system permease protein
MPQSLPSSNSLPHRPLRLFAGAAVGVGIAGLIALVLWSIASTAATEPGTGGSRVDVVGLLVMTSTQAGLTTSLSLAVGIAMAWALNRLRFPGRDLIVGLFASAIVTPGIIVAFGLLAIWGRAGWVAELTGFQFPIFGLGGILFAHVILDASFAARILLARLDSIPPFRLKTGQSLGLSAWQRFALIDWPAMRTTLPGLAAIIFLLAFTSFPIVLLLGGGPANQTLEVAIYSAVRLDFDLPGAVTLALVQIGVCAVIILVASAAAPIPANLGRSQDQRWQDGPAVRLTQWLVLGVAVLGFGLPLLAILVDGLGPGLGSLLRQPAFWRSVGASLSIAATSTVLTLALGLTLAAGRAASGQPLVRTSIGVPAYAYLAVPAVVLALGFFLLARNAGIDPALAAPPVVVLANTLLALPYAVSTLAPPLDAIAARRGKLIRSLGLSGRRQFAAVEWPLIAGEVGVVAALAFCFSLGDLGVISLFGTQDFATLPLLMSRALGAYRTNDAAGIAAVMLLITVAAFVLIPKLFGRFADART